MVKLLGYLKAESQYLHDPRGKVAGSYEKLTEEVLGRE